GHHAVLSAARRARPAGAGPGQRVAEVRREARRQGLPVREPPEAEGAAGEEGGRTAEVGPARADLRPPGVAEPGRQPGVPAPLGRPSSPPRGRGGSRYSGSISKG